MAKKIILDPGHGGHDPGAVGRGQYGTFVEKDNALKIARLCQEYLLKYFNNVSVQLTRSGDSTMSLSARTAYANRLGADFFLSIHQNAGGGYGYEDFIYDRLSDSSGTAKMRNAFHQEVVSRVLNKYGIRNRGKKKANFHVLRESNMEAILVETLFVDGASDQKLMKEKPQVLTDFAHAYAEGIAKALGLSRKASPPPSIQKPTSGTLYRVQTGAFKGRSNAESLQSQLKRKGYSAYVKQEGSLYKVQVGAFSVKQNANELVADLKKDGFSAFIDS